MVCRKQIPLEFLVLKLTFHYIDVRQNVCEIPFLQKLVSIFPEDEEAHYGKYGMLRKTYLKEHRKAYYQMLIRQGKLNKHLNKVDREAHERMDILVAQMAEKQGVTELFKAEQPMLWVRKMNGIRTAAEEMVLTEIVYG